MRTLNGLCPARAKVTESHALEGDLVHVVLPQKTILTQYFWFLVVKPGPNTRVIPGDPTVVAPSPKGAGSTMSQFRDQPEAANLKGASKRELLEGYCG